MNTTVPMLKLFTPDRACSRTNNLRASPVEFSSQYAIIRYIGNEKKPALLQLGKKDGVLIGTIATSTGDSRFLTGYGVEGALNLWASMADSFTRSCDGEK